MVLDLSCRNCSFTNENYYVFQPKLLSGGNGANISNLALGSCILGQGLFDKLPSLVLLSLSRVTVDSNIIANILSCCSKLECLLFYKCNLPDPLCVSGPGLQLRSIHILLCQKVHKIELSALNLNFIGYCGYNLQFCFLEVPNLEILFVRLYCRNEMILLSSICGELPAVERLWVYAATSWVHYMPKHAASFSKLKQLRLFSPDVSDFDILKMISILKGCILLEELHVVGKSFDGPADVPFQCTHMNLKKVRLSGFYKIWDQIGFVIYLLESAVTLEEMIIEPWIEVYDGKEWIRKENAHWSPKEKQKIRDLLQDFLKTATLVVR